MSNSHCPDKRQIVDFFQGRLDEAEARALEPHLSACGECRKTMEAVADDDTLLDVLRTIRGKDFKSRQGEEGEVSLLISRLRDMPAVRGTNSRPSFSATDLEFLKSADNEDELGRLGPYRILQFLGEGGMGIVFEAEDMQLKRRVALKVIRPNLAKDRRIRDRFLREAQAAARIENEHIVPVHQVGHANDVLYIAMQRLSGESLADRLAGEGRLPIGDALSIARQIALGLAAAHAQGLIHRDIKPENLWIDGRGRVKILDFGLARLQWQLSDLTPSDALLGTPHYMSPEQARGQDPAPANDLYSLGAVLFAMLAGRPPFDAKSIAAVVLALVERPPPRLRSVRPETPAEVDELVHRLLSKDPAERPAAASSLAEEIEQIELQWNSGTAPAPGHGFRKTAMFSILATAAFALLLLAAALVVRLTTDRGEVVVQAPNAADLKIALEKEQIRVRDLKQNRTYTLKLAQQPLPSGEYELEVADSSGLKFKARHFAINRGKQTTLQAWSEPATAAAPAPETKRSVTNIKVPATRHWTATGIRVADLVSLHIKAAGQIQASGEDRAYYHDVPPEGRDERHPHFPFPVLPGLALIGRFGTGPAFYVGRELEMQFAEGETHGELMLGVNDDLVHDNMGEWQVEITIQKR